MEETPDYLKPKPPVQKSEPMPDPIARWRGGNILLREIEEMQLAAQRAERSTS